MVVCIGEILIDLFLSKDNRNSFEYHVGGAPFNVACNLSKLNSNVSFIGAVGNDLFGKICLDYVNKTNLKNTNIQVLNKYNTTLSLVSLDENNERDFSFIRNNTADYHISLNNQVKAIIDNAKIVHLGSLMLNKNVGVHFIKDLLKYLENKNKIVSFDVNYRQDIFQNNLINIRYVMKKANIVKLSEDEINLFYNKGTLKDKINHLFDNSQCVFITCGKNGSKAFYNNKEYTCDKILNISTKDTTGAGDAFFSGALYIISNKYNNNFDLIDFNYLLKFANICGGLTASSNGAISDKLNYDEIIKYL